MSSADPEGKTFFPDSWSEGKIITAIKEAYGSATFIDGSTNSYIGNISFYNLQGREVYSQSVFGQQNELFIDVSTFHAGMYCMSFRDEQSFVATKVLIYNK